MALVLTPAFAGSITVVLLVLLAHSSSTTSTGSTKGSSPIATSHWSGNGTNLTADDPIWLHYEHHHYHHHIHHYHHNKRPWEADHFPLRRQRRVAPHMNPLAKNGRHWPPRRYKEQHQNKFDANKFTEQMEDFPDLKDVDVEDEPPEDSLDMSKYLPSKRGTH